MSQTYKRAGVLLWTIALVMAVSALVVSGNLPGGAYRSGLWLVVLAFGAKAIHGLLWGSVKGHWAAFAYVGLFFVFSLTLYVGQHIVSTERGKWFYVAAMTMVPVVGLIIVKTFRASRARSDRVR